MRQRRVHLPRRTCVVCLDEVPSDLPANITSLDLQGNSIVYVRDLALARYTDLESISFAENNIVAILANAFKGPRNLSHVDLANNEVGCKRIYPIPSLGVDTHPVVSSSSRCSSPYCKRVRSLPLKTRSSFST